MSEASVQSATEEILSNTASCEQHPKCSVPSGPGAIPSNVTV